MAKLTRRLPRGRYFHHLILSLTQGPQSMPSGSPFEQGLIYWVSGWPSPQAAHQLPPSSAWCEQSPRWGPPEAGWSQDKSEVLSEEILLSQSPGGLLCPAGFWWSAEGVACLGQLGSTLSPPAPRHAAS